MDAIIIEQSSDESSSDEPSDNNATVGSFADEGRRLVDAFRRITDARKRAKLIALAEEMAAETPPETP